MALLVLIVLGASLGWLASILARTEAPGTILRQVALGKRGEHLGHVAHGTFAGIQQLVHTGR